MAYRHQVMSDTFVPPKQNLPKWFKEKYIDLIDFDRQFWVSYSEYKKYLTLKELENDIQKVLKEINHQYVRLIYFADEETSCIDLQHVLITPEHIHEVDLVDFIVPLVEEEK